MLSDILKNEIEKKKKRLTRDFPILQVSLPIHVLLPEGEVDLSLSFHSSLYYSELKLNLAVQFLCKDDYIYTIHSSSLGFLTYSSDPSYGPIDETYGLVYHVEKEEKEEEEMMRNKSRKRQRIAKDEIGMDDVYSTDMDPSDLINTRIQSKKIQLNLFYY